MKREQNQSPNSNISLGWVRMAEILGVSDSIEVHKLIWYHQLELTFDTIVPINALAECQSQFCFVSIMTLVFKKRKKKLIACQVKILR